MQDILVIFFVVAGFTVICPFAISYAISKFERFNLTNPTELG